MIEIKCINTHNESYTFMENLLESSFPADERRDREIQRLFTDKKEIFYTNIVLDDDKPVGLINYWNLDKVYYIEHFAVSPLLRNKGYGEKTLSLMKTILSDRPIILEVEIPIGEMEKRRVAFYERNGFVRHDIKYVQPPYRKNGNSINMNIMFYGKDLLTLDMDDVIGSLYKEVYDFPSL